VNYTTHPAKGQGRREPSAHAARSITRWPVRLRREP